MRHIFLLGLLTAAFLSSSVPTARAEGEASVFIGRFYVGQLPLQPNATVGATIGGSGSILGFEFGIDYTPAAPLNVGPVTASASLANVMGNAVVHVPLGPVEPYGTIGYGAFIARARVNGVSGDFTGVLGALNLGFGAKIFLTENVGVRGEYRRFSLRAPDGLLNIPAAGVAISALPNLDRITVGASFRF